jgi:hypothetical protein
VPRLMISNVVPALKIKSLLVVQKIVAAGPSIITPVIPLRVVLLVTVIVP